MQIPHSPPSPPGTSTNHSHCWHTSPCPCFQCHGLDKQVVLINFALKNEPGHMRASLPDLFVCFMSREFYQARQRCCRNSWRISSDLLSGHDTSCVVCRGEETICLDLTEAARYLSRHKTQTDRVTQTKLALLNETAAALFPTDPNDEENVQVRPQR